MVSGWVCKFVVPFIYRRTGIRLCIHYVRYWPILINHMQLLKHKQNISPNTQSHVLT